MSQPHIDQIVLANDCAWDGWGWAVCRPSGPIWTGHVRLAGGWEFWKLRRYLVDVLELELAEAQNLRSAGSPPVGLAIEKPPNVYRRGNQAATGWGLGKIVGPLAVWGTRPEGEVLRYPWLLGPREWRAFWGLKGNRDTVKQRAIDLVRRKGWGSHLDAYEGPIRAKSGKSKGQIKQWPQGDVAEAILIGVGTAQRAGDWPRGPQRGVDLSRPGLDPGSRSGYC